MIIYPSEEKEFPQRLGIHTSVLRANPFNGPRAHTMYFKLINFRVFLIKKPFVCRAFSRAAASAFNK